MHTHKHTYFCETNHDRLMKCELMKSILFSSVCLKMCKGKLCKRKSIKNGFEVQGISCTPLSLKLLKCFKGAYMILFKRTTGVLHQSCIVIHCKRIYRFKLSVCIVVQFICIQSCIHYALGFESLIYMSWHSLKLNNQRSWRKFWVENLIKRRMSIVSRIWSQCHVPSRAGIISRPACNYAHFM